MEIQKIQISKINPAAYNPRKDLQSGDLEYEKLKKSITEFDLVEPLIWNKRTNNLIGGHQRLKILKEQGKTEVDVSVVDLSEVKEKALNIALNKISGDWDLPKLKDLLQELDTGEFDIEITGFNEQEIEDLINQLYVPDENEQDDQVPEVPEELITKKGDLYKLGEHRLLCGDATIIDDVEKLMDGQKADMVFTDPPYGVDYSGGIQFTNHGVLKEQREKLVNDDSTDIYTEVIPIISSYCEGACYVWFAGTKASNLYKAVEAVGEIHALIIWVKNGGYAAMNANYKQKHEPCLYWKPKGKKLSFVGLSTETTVWDLNKDGINKLHPTQKPVALAEKAIRNHSVGLILDLFGGSGSTLIACEKLNRKCFMMELDPHYCDVIVKRWEDYTGKKAELL